jgi:hypothetical protein
VENLLEEMHRLVENHPERTLLEAFLAVALVAEDTHLVAFLVDSLEVDMEDSILEGKLLVVDTYLDLEDIEDNNPEDKLLVVDTLEDMRLVASVGRLVVAYLFEAELLVEFGLLDLPVEV